MGRGYKVHVGRATLKASFTELEEAKKAGLTAAIRMCKAAIADAEKFLEKEGE